MYAVEFMYEKDNPYEEDKNASPYCRLCYEFTNENILVDHVMYYCDPKALAQLRAYLGPSSPFSPATWTNFSWSGWGA